MRSVSHRRIVVCLAPGEGSVRAVGVACLLAADRHALLTAIAAIEVPLGLPLDLPDRAADAAARSVVHSAQAVAASYGVPIRGVVLHARDAGEAIVSEAALRDAEIILIAEQSQKRQSGRLSGTTEYVLKHAGCRVMLLGGVAQDGPDNNGASEPLFRSGQPSDYWPSGEFVDRAVR